MSKIKVLPLPSCFNCSKEWWIDCLEETNKITPIFNRNGYYYDRLKKITWLEINGEAWKYGSVKSFQYDLKINIGNNRIHNELYQALKTLIGYRLATNKQREIFSIEHDMRQIYRLNVNDLYKVKRIKAFIQKHKGQNEKEN